MSSIPSNLTRAPNLLTAQLFASQLGRTNVDLLRLQGQMSSLRAVSRMSDDAVRASAISTLDGRIERTAQRMTNLDTAGDILDRLDSSLGDAADLVREAKSIASGQIGVGSDAVTRNNQAVVIESMITALVDVANRETRGVYIFGGSTPSRPPLVAVNGGYRYIGQGSGLVTDLDIGERVPITLGGDNAIGEISARLRTTTDLNPGLTGDTRLASVVGGRGLGVSPGIVSFSFDGGPSATVDLTGADTMQDVADAVTAAIRQYEADNAVTVLGPGGVSFSGGALAVDVVSGTPLPDPQLTFSDTGSGTTAQDLGLAQAPFDAATPAGTDINARLTLQTPVTALAGVTQPMGSVRIRMTTGAVNSVHDIDLSSAETIDDIRRLIEDSSPGVRVRINSAGTGINVYNEVAGPGLSIEEVPGGADTATELGIRSFHAQTATTELNDGRGVRIVDGATDPVTGAPDPARDVDFRIHLGNGDAFTVDLRPSDMTTVQDVIDRINAEAGAAMSRGEIPPGSFSAGLTDGENGIAFNDPLALGEITVEKQNNSPAADDLGLMSGTYDATSARLVSQDRATVRVQNVLTTLMDLRDALRNNDSDGITLAGSQLDQHVDRLNATHGLVGVYGQRVEQAHVRQQDLDLLDQSTKSQLQDLDFTDASVRYNVLQTQLQAAMTVGARAQSTTLLDFLG